MKILYKGLLALVFVIAESALVTIALQIGGSAIGAVPMLLYSSLLGTLVILVVIYLQDRGKELSVLVKDRKGVAILFVAGLFGFGVGTLALTWGTIGTTPSVSAIVYRTYPIMIAIFTPLALKQRVSRRQLFALILGIVGVAIVLSDGGLATVNMAELPYVALVMFSALATAASTLAIRAYNTSTSAYMLLGNLSSLALAILLILFFHMSIALTFSIPVVLSILLIGGIEMGVGTLLFYYCYRTFSTTTAGLGMLAIPFLTVMLSFALLGTPIHSYYFVAAIMLTLGVLVQEGVFKAPEHISSKNATAHAQIYDITSAFLDTNVEAIRRVVRGNGRVLAVKLHNANYGKVRDMLAQSQAEDTGSNIVYTHADDRYVSRDQERFITEIIGREDHETVLIVAGQPDKGEGLLNDIFASLSDSGNVPSAERASR